MASKTLVRAQRIIDGSGRVIDHGAILIADASIEAVGRAAEIGQPSDVEIIDLGPQILPSTAQLPPSGPTLRSGAAAPTSSPSPGNPLEHLDTLRAPHLVITGGRIAHRTHQEPAPSCGSGD